MPGLPPAARYGFCRVFVDADNREQVEAAVPPVPEVVMAEVRPNPDRAHRRDDFVLWPWCVEVEQTNPAENVGIVDFTQALLDALEGVGVRAVAAADFEDELHQRHWPPQLEP